MYMVRIFFINKSATMNNQHFENLLNDLYDRFNPNKKSEIPNIITKYNGQEFDAIYYLLMKYNYATNANYDPAIGTQSNVKNLIDQYSKGNRILLNKDVKLTEKDILGLAAEKVQSEIKSTVQEVDDKFSKNLEDLNLYIKNKKEEIDTSLENVKKLLEVNTSIPVNKSEIRINKIFSEDIDIPIEVHNACIGSRFLVPNLNSEENKFIGFEIKDIFFDCISYPGKCIKEITIEKV